MNRKHLAAVVGAALFSAAGVSAQGDAAFGNIDLTDGQRQRIAAIQEEAWSRHWDLMKALYALDEGRLGAGTNEADIRNRHEAMELVRTQMSEARLAAQHDIEALLTEEQRLRWREDSADEW